MIIIDSTQLVIDISCKKYYIEDKSPRIKKVFQKPMKFQHQNITSKVASTHLFHSKFEFVSRPRSGARHHHINVPRGQNMMLFRRVGMMKKHNRILFMTIIGGINRHDTLHIIPNSCYWFYSKRSTPFKSRVLLLYFKLRS